MIRRGMGLDEMVVDFFRQLGFSTEDMKMRPNARGLRVVWTMGRPDAKTHIKGSLWLWPSTSRGKGARGMASVYVRHRGLDNSAGTVVGQVKAGSIRGVLERLVPYYQNSPQAMLRSLSAVREKLDYGNRMGKRYVAGDNLRALNALLRTYRLDPVSAPA
jgi:hypothetical protein